MSICQQKYVQATPEVSTGSPFWPTWPGTWWQLGIIKLMPVKGKWFGLLCLIPGWSEDFPSRTKKKCSGNSNDTLIKHNSHVGDTRAHWQGQRKFYFCSSENMQMFMDSYKLSYTLSSSALWTHVANSSNS